MKITNMTFFFLKGRQIINVKLTNRNPEELINFCNTAWAKYSGDVSRDI